MQSLTFPYYNCLVISGITQIKAFTLKSLDICLCGFNPVTQQIGKFVENSRKDLLLDYIYLLYS
ncbi:hypothetical protein PbDSM24746_25080 [Paenibacillus macerans]|nr:hypothetical protein PbDSM24746_25080 [Paenibacillus macerans]GBK68816.1 hypothetical protein PbJCM17693_25240 [Paenibacillus macerans]